MGHLFDHFHSSWLNQCSKYDRRQNVIVIHGTMYNYNEYSFERGNKGSFNIKTNCRLSFILSVDRYSGKISVQFA